MRLDIIQGPRSLTRDGTEQFTMLIGDNLEWDRPHSCDAFARSRAGLSQRAVIVEWNDVHRRQCEHPCDGSEPLVRRRLAEG